jgi:hypothetical protein
VDEKLDSISLMERNWRNTWCINTQKGMMEYLPDILRATKDMEVKISYGEEI